MSSKIGMKPYMKHGIAAMVVVCITLAAVGFAGLMLTGTKEGPDSEAPLREGIGALKAGDYATAWRLIGPFADAGNTLAQQLVGEMFAFGLGVAPDDRQAAIWLRRAECRCANSGEKEYYLALSYLNGEGVHQDKHLAVGWLRRSAEAGYIPAQQHMSDKDKLTRDGLVVPGEESVYWLRFPRSISGTELQ